METHVELAFLVQALQHHSDVLSLTPVLSGTPLPQLALAYEREHGFEPAGGYGGIVPSWFAYGPLERYFMGESDNPYFADGCYLLGCADCGEVGCWPLRARIKKHGNIVVWDCFRQEHRPTRDYSNFGPFMFDVEAYKAAVVDAAARFQN